MNSQGLPSQVTTVMRVKIRGRDGLICQYCGATTTGKWVVEHVIPAAMDGPALPYNLTVACGSCNTRKGRSVWIPRNLDSITADYPAWRQRVLDLAEEGDTVVLRLRLVVTRKEQGMIISLSPEEQRRRLLTG